MSNSQNILLLTFLVSNLSQEVSFTPKFHPDLIYLSISFYSFYNLQSIKGNVLRKNQY